MLVPCEVAVKCALPVIRGMIAKNLVTKHNMRQAQVAELLGVSQPAVSLYYRKIRGKAMDLEDNAEIMVLVENLADCLVKGNLSYQEFIRMLCEICRAIRAKGLLCRLHEVFDPSIASEKCGLCSQADPARCF